MPFRSLLWTFTVNIRMNGTDCFIEGFLKNSPQTDIFPFSKDLSLKCAPTYSFESRSVYNLRVNGEPPRLAV